METVNITCTGWNKIHQCIKWLDSYTVPVSNWLLLPPLSITRVRSGKKKQKKQKILLSCLHNPIFLDLKDFKNIIYASL